jgi:hypothetical protein
MFTILKGQSSLSYMMIEGTGFSLRRDKLRVARGDARGELETRYARKREPAKRLALKAQVPVLLPCIIGNVLQCLPYFSAAFVEHTHKLLRGLSKANGLKLPWEKSRPGVVDTVSPNPANSPTCGASLPNGMDLVCGVKSFLSAGTRSKVVRVFREL